MAIFPPQFNDPSKISVIKDFLNNEEINYLLNGMHDISFERAQIQDQTIDSNAYRKSSIKWLENRDKFRNLYDKCSYTIHQLNSFSWKFDLKESNDSFQYTEYDSSIKGKYDWHIDIGNDIASFRKISLVIQLSDFNEYEGGNLEIFDPGGTDPTQDFPTIKIPKEIGTAVIFPSYFPHRVTPVTKGLRKSLVWWVGGTPFK